MASITRDKVFISYSRRDKRWLDRLQKMLKPLVRVGAIDVWTDTAIVPGADWRQEIKDGLASARVAVLLVSAEFLASDFITEEELAPLLRAAKEEGVKILWVYLSPCHYKETAIGDYQAAHDVAKSLLELRFPKQQLALLEISQQIKKAFTDTVEESEKHRQDEAEARRKAEGLEEYRQAELEARREAEELQKTSSGRSGSETKADKQDEHRQIAADASRKTEKQKRFAAADANEEVVVPEEVPENPEPPRNSGCSKPLLWISAIALVFVLSQWLESRSGHPKVSQSPPAVSLTAQPANIERCETTILSWVIAGANKARIDPDIGSLGLWNRGTERVSPRQDTVYTLVASGWGGTTKETVKVTVREPHSRPPNPRTPESEAKGKELITKAVEGIGDAGRLKALKTYRSEIERKDYLIDDPFRDPVIHTIRVIFSLPNRMREEVGFGGVGTVVTVLNGESSFVQSSLSSRASLLRQAQRTTQEKSLWRRFAWLLLMHRDDDTFKAFATGASEVDCTSVERVHVVLRSDAYSVGIDAETGRILSITYMVAAGEKQRTFSDFRHVDGLLLPMASLTTRDGELSLSDTVKSVELDVAVDDSIFLPEAR